MIFFYLSHNLKMAIEITMSKTNTDRVTANTVLATLDEPGASLPVKQMRKV